MTAPAGDLPAVVVDPLARAVVLDATADVVDDPATAAAVVTRHG